MTYSYAKGNSLLTYTKINCCDIFSADLWVPGSQCPSTECPNTNFVETQSSTFKNLNKPFTLVYGIGDVNGTYATDTVSMAGATVQNQQFGVASDTQQILTNPNTITVSEVAEINNTALDVKSLAANNNPVANGILGLGYPRLTAASSKGLGAYNPFVFNLASQNVIKEPIFSIYMNDAKELGYVGEIIFGGIDETKFTGNLTYLPVAPPTTNKKKRDININSNNVYWMVHAQGVAVTDTQNPSANIIDLPLTSPGTFIFDTGTTLTYLPQDFAKQIVEAMVGNNGYTIDAGSGAYIVSCDAAQSTTQFELKMVASVSSKDAPVILSVPASQLVIPLDATTAEDANFCLFGIAPTTSTVNGSNRYLIGDSILRSAYIVFDMANDRIGLASAKNVGGSVQGVSSQTSNGKSMMNQSSVVFALMSCLLMAILSF